MPQDPAKTCNLHRYLSIPGGRISFSPRTSDRQSSEIGVHRKGRSLLCNLEGALFEFGRVQVFGAQTTLAAVCSTSAESCSVKNSISRALRLKP